MPTEEELEAMTKDELKATADELGVDYGSHETKAELVSDIMQQQGGGGVATLEAAPEEEGVGIEQQMVALGYTPGVPGSSTITDWRSWAAQQGGMLAPGAGQPPPVPGPGAGGQPYPLIISDKILGSQSTPIYADIPTYIKPADLYNGWTAQLGFAPTNQMVAQPFPPPAVLLSRVMPNFGPAAGGTGSWTIQGTGFTGATGVQVGGIAVVGYTIVNDTTITFTTLPALAPAVAGSYVGVSVIKGGVTTTLPNSFRCT